MTVRLTECHRLDDAWFVELTVRGAPDGSVAVAQAETGLTVDVPTDASGEGRARVRLPVVPSVPYTVLLGGGAVCVIGAEQADLDEVAERGGAHPGTVVTAVGGVRVVRRDLTLRRAHLFLGPDTTLRFGRDAGIRIEGGTVRAIGTASQPVVLEPIGASWRNLTLLDGFLSSRLAHCRIRGGRGRRLPVGRAGDATAGGALAAVHAGDLELVEVCVADSAADLGGGVYAEDVTVRWDGVRFERNRAGQGGAAALRHVEGTVRGLTADGNAAGEGPILSCCLCDDLRIEDPELVTVAPLGARA